MFKINEITYLKFLVANRYMRKYNMTPQEFLDFANERDLFGYLELAYEPLHLTGIDGIMEEVEHYLGTVK